MKKCFALFLSLALLLSCVTAAFAEEIGVVPYEIAALDTVIYIPENMTVTDETETDENVSVTLALNGREDCGFGLNIGYSEAYEGYTMLTLPDDARQEMIDYYAQNYAGANEPSVMEMEDEYADFSPLIAAGKGADGNLYCTYVMVYDGFIITTYGAIAADEFDYDSYGALYTLYFQVIDMLMG